MLPAKRKRSAAEAPDSVEKSLAFAAKGISKIQLKSISKKLGQEASATRLYQATEREVRQLLIRETLVGNDGDVEWDLCDPVLLVQHVLDRSSALRAVYAEKLAEHPMPWHIVIGYDEHVPGDKLKVKNLRKSMVVSFNFLEVGENILQMDCSWFIPIIMRSTKIDEVSGGWSQALRAFLRRMLVHDMSPAKAGIPLTIDGTTHVIRAVVSDIISDGDGHRQGLEWLGAGALKPCFLHGNVFSKNSGMADANCVTIAEHNHARFALNTHAEIYRNASIVVGARDLVKDGGMTQARFEQVRKAAGLGTTSHGLLADADLQGSMKILEVIIIDWLHSLFQEGAMSIEVFEMLDAAKAGGLTRERVRAHVGSWAFPKHFQSKGNQLARFFDNYRADRMDSKRVIVGGASEQYVLYPLIRHLVDTEVTDPAFANNVESFRAACRVVDVIKLTKTRQIDIRSAKGLLLESIQEFLLKHKRAYGVERMRPKHHWLFDMACTAFRRQMPLDMFITERLHLRVKPEAELVRNTTAYERSSLALVLCTQLDELEKGHLHSGLRGRVVQFPGSSSALCADALVCSGLCVGTDDIVFYLESAGCVLACLLDDGELLVLVEELLLVARATAQTSKWRLTTTRALWKASELNLAHAWREEGDGCITVIRI